jgi:formamidopyrimidine-DNA glycosylase
MPELPEVETVVRALRSHLIDQHISVVASSGKRLRYPFRRSDFKSLIGCRITDVKRRAKYICVTFDTPQMLILHLGMTGSFRVEHEPKRERHDHLMFTLSNGSTWIFNDPRRFGFYIVQPLLDDANFPAYFDVFGPEPLSDAFNTDYLHAILRKKKQGIKATIMDNRVVVGVGNIYASESLFRAGIRPQRRAHTISKTTVDCLINDIRSVLNDAIAAGGTTISNYRSVDGTEGLFARQLDVYGRDGDGCSKCRNGTIKKIVQAGRSSFYCPICQS